MQQKIQASMEESLLQTTHPKFIEELFRAYYSPMVKLVNRMLRNAEASEDIVQDVFVKVWNNRINLDKGKSIKSYLYRSAINTAINYLEKDKRSIRLDHNDLTSHSTIGSQTEEGLNLKELERKVSEAIDSLPPRCKAVFVMSRYEELSYKEIAESMEISIKTVENQMGKALSIMREHLKLYIR